MNEIIRFWNKVEITPSCWNWTANKDRTGYGRFKLKKGLVRSAHRFLYEKMVTKIPDGLQIDHLCRNRACVNPSHLDVVTLKENIRRTVSFNGSKTHCPQGHEYNEDNIYVWKNGRHCITCRKAAGEERRNGSI